MFAALIFLTSHKICVIYASVPLRNSVLSLLCAATRRAFKFQNDLSQSVQKVVLYVAITQILESSLRLVI
jgi:hypothetical protein